MKIGLFDSGFGGMTIMRAVRAALPQYDYLYYGDTKNVPYGDKTSEEIYGFMEQAVEHLFSRGALVIVVACNTASTQALRKLQDTFLKERYPDRRILGVIIPTIEEMIAQGTHRALLVGTTHTVNSRKYDIELEKATNVEIKLESVATPTLVPLIESGKINDALHTLTEVIDSRVGEIDAVVLACTHYTVLAKPLRARYATLRILSQDDIIPAKLAEYLQRHPELESKLGKGGTLSVHFTSKNTTDPLS
ncbi:glutamate racemase [Candidatus Kaiserbacteria bacterium]|nr:glutamate racemase [Candidatus Kaiserbacteria bacterium]